MSTNTTQHHHAINTWWENEGLDTLTSIAALKQQAQAKETQITDINNLRAGYNPISFLKNAWIRATQLQPLKHEKAALEAEQGALHGKLQQRAKQDADMALRSIAETDNAISTQLETIEGKRAPLARGFETIRDVEQRTSRLLSTIDRAWEEVKDAKGMEMWDMIGNNAALSLLSHMETSEAKKHLQKVQTEIASYKTFMADRHSDISHITESGLETEEIAKIAEWDLWLGIADIGILSTFTSWRNYEQLGKAKESLEALQEAIRPFANDSKKMLGNTKSALDAINSEYESFRLATVGQAADLNVNFVRTLRGEEPVTPALKKTAPTPQRK